MSPAASALRELVAKELSRTPPPAGLVLAEEARRRLGETVSAVLFYGSCLRRESAEGVLDFYALVDDYRDVRQGHLLARANAWLPPNVFYLEHEATEGTLRAKVAVISSADFERASRPERPEPRIWSRFSQPALLAWTRDAHTRARVEAAVAESVLTMVRHGFSLGDGAPDPLAVWRVALRETYGAEFRSERAETIDGIVDAAAPRYEEAARLALGVVEADADWARRWPRRRRRAKRRAALGLLKSAATFDDWPSYALWKLERQSGVRLEASERQRRHPFLFGWPLLIEAFRRGVLR